MVGAISELMAVADGFVTSACASAPLFDWGIMSADIPTQTMQMIKTLDKVLQAMLST